MSNEFIGDLDGYVYADELIRTVDRVTGGRPRSRHTAKGQLQIRLNKDQAVNALAAWYAEASCHQTSPLQQSRPTAVPAAEHVTVPRAMARYFEDEKPTTRKEYFNISLDRTKQELCVKGPCPSCGTDQQFAAATKRQAGAVAKVIGGLLSQPVRTLSDMFTSTDCAEMSCSRCDFGVTICGQCDQINPHTATRCTWCGHNML